MNTKEMVLATGGLLVVGLVAVLLIRWIGSDADKPVVHPVITEKILVATRDLPTDTVMKWTDMRWLAYPRSQVQKRYIQQSKYSNTDFVGRLVQFPIQKDQPIEERFLDHENLMGDLAKLIKPGMYSITMILDRTDGNSGFIMPGDKIDIIMTRPVSVGGAQRGYVSQTILFHILVLAVGSVTFDSGSKTVIPSDNLTLQVSAREAELLALGKAMGDLSYVLNAGTGTSSTSRSYQESPLYSGALDPLVGPSITEYHGGNVVLDAGTK